MKILIAAASAREVYKERLKRHDFLQESSAAKQEKAP